MTVTPSGLKYNDEKVGDGDEAKTGDTVTVRGAKAADGTITATSIIATAKGVQGASSGGSLAGGGGAQGGGAGGSSTTGGQQ